MVLEVFLVASREPTTSGKVEKPIYDLKVADGSKADSTYHVFLQQVFVVFMCLIVGSKLTLDMQVVVELQASQYVPGRVLGGYTVVMWE